MFYSGMLNSFISIDKYMTMTSPYKRSSNNHKKKLNIYYYNDTHGNSDQMAGVVESAKIFRQKHALDKDSVNFVLSAGDNVSGASKEKNNFIFNIMQNIMGVNVSAVGNHELDATSHGFFDTIKDKKLKFVATNVKYDKDNPLNDVVQKSIVIEEQGEKFGFVGAMPQDFKTCTKVASQKGIEIENFEDTVKSIQQEVDNLKKQGINKIILMSHSGYEMDKKLAAALDGVDIIIGGHSHSIVEGAQYEENIVMSKSNEPVIIVQAGENGKYYGILETEFDAKGIITKLGNKLFESTNKTKSPKIEYIKSQELGESPIVAKISKIDPMPKNRRIEPCAWTDLIADSIRDEMDVDIAIVNAANTRKVPQEGTLTKRDIEESSPMKNKLIKTKITQKQLVDSLKQALKESLSDEEGVPGILHYSGIKYKADKKGNLIEMSYIDKNGNINPIDINNPSENVIYSASYDDFVAKKDKGEYPILAPKFEVQTFDFDKDETLCKYLAKREDKDNLIVTDDKRIEIV